MSRRSSIIFTIMVFALGSFAGFFSGREWSRSQIRWLAEQVADAQGKGVTNTFGRCLTENWELTGELDPAWKGKRGWKLADREAP